MALSHFHPCSAHAHSARSASWPALVAPGRPSSSFCHNSNDGCARLARRRAAVFVAAASARRRLAAVLRPTAAASSDGPAGGSSVRPPAAEEAQQREAAFRALVAELAPLPEADLRAAAAARPDQLLDSRFLFWLRDEERRPGATAAEREALGRLGSQLTLMREWTEERANRQLLPALASSLAYANLQRYRQETGAASPRVAEGVSLEQLYRLGEEEERKLRESAGEAGLGPRRGVTRSSIEEFTKHNKAYADLAAGAMARVRARLSGFDDSPASAAAAVLRALSAGMGSAEERATWLPDAFTPPGLQVLPEPATGASGISSGGAGAGAAAPAMAVTTPSALVAAARARLAELGTSPAAAAATAAAGSQTVPTASAAEQLPVGDVQPQSQPQARAVLPSGEDEAAVLGELIELVEEYDRAVYSRRSPLERLGHGSGPWRA